jgi:predicted dehydrogenase
MLTTGTSQFYHAHKAELQHFVNSLINDKTPTPTGEDGLNALQARAAIPVTLELLPLQVAFKSLL